jgi:hypothetical protein
MVGGEKNTHTLESLSITSLTFYFGYEYLCLKINSIFCQGISKKLKLWNIDFFFFFLIY